MRVRNLIFDVGGVLLDWSPARILERYYADAGERATMQAAIFLHADWLALDQGLITEPELLERVERRAGRPVPELGNLFQHVRESLLPKHDSVALLQTLAARRVPLYCLSNMPVNAYAYLRERYDFWRYFDGIVISGEVRMVKPQPEIFQYLLQRHGLAASETVFIDDHVPNVQAAGTLGLHTVLFANARQCEQALAAHLSWLP